MQQAVDHAVLYWRPLSDSAQLITNCYNYITEVTERQSMKTADGMHRRRQRDIMAKDLGNRMLTEITTRVHHATVTLSVT